MRKVLSFIWKIITAPFRLVAWLLKTIFGFFRTRYLKIKNFFTEEPEDSPIGDVLQTGFENPSSILFHLNELRKHIFRAVIGFALATMVAFYFITPILDWISAPVGGIDQLQAIEVTESIGVVMRVALLSGFTVSLPYIVFELMLFAAPGLSPRARVIGILSLPLVILFFVGGMLFSYYYLLDPALEVLLNFMGIPTLPRPSSYIRFVTTLMFWIGVSFEFPLVTYVLAAMRILKPSLLRDNWRIAVVLIAVLAAMITPTIDPINMLIVMVPLLLLYAMGVLMAYLAWSGRRKEEAQQA
ncbi:MAG TPA: twin-arginine translocase subunit TatC [Anaerolineales bacterium]|nr:twin-arginine translocase subunit TatC [Anaerolineales bacterium]